PQNWFAARKRRTRTPMFDDPALADFGPALGAIVFERDHDRAVLEHGLPVRRTQGLDLGGRILVERTTLHDSVGELDLPFAGRQPIGGGRPGWIADGEERECESDDNAQG